MYVSKNAVLGLVLAAAGLLGWFSQSIVARLGEPVAPAAVVSSSIGQAGPDDPSAAGEPAGPDETTSQGLGGTTPVAAGDPTASDSNVYMTIVNSAGGSERAEPVVAVANATATSTVTGRGAASNARSGGPLAYAPVVGPRGPQGATGPSGSGGAGQPQVNVNGNNITIASNGAVVMIGDGGDLNANTGDTAASGTVAIDAQGSTLQSGSSTMVVAAGETGPDVTSAGAAQPSLSAASLTGTTPTHSNSSLDSMLAGLGGTGTSVAVAGFEDHSVSVIGDDHLVTYDDSNVFVNRNGPVNANTGDTDSSGLNVVDAVDSVVRSGNSGDGEGSGDDEEEEEDEEEPGAPLRAGDEFSSMDLAGTDSRTMSSLAAPMTGASAGVDDEDVATTANGSNAFVIGADGFDDVSIRVNGNRDIVTYDDSNVVLGGTGPVNAQIGDSDTAGAVVMGVRNSYIQAGCEGDLCYSGQTP